MWETPSLEQLINATSDPNSPVGKRMRAAYFLRQRYDLAVSAGASSSSSSTSISTVNDDECKNENGVYGGDSMESKNDDGGDHEDFNRNVERKEDEIVVHTLSNALKDVRHGPLLRHEYAYVMGQLRDERCCPALETTLSNRNDDIMVRHECGEALGAIGSIRSIPVLEREANAIPRSVEVSETCELALDFLKWKHGSSISSSSSNRDGHQKNHGDGNGDAPPACACMLNPYSSVDPAPPHPSHALLSSDTIGAILLDSERPLFERYRAMFSLRNRGSAADIEQLGLTLINDKSSALLRHEVAYVLGQTGRPDSLDFLKESLGRLDESNMVRHEAAEALGAIDGGRWDEVEAVLKDFMNDDDVVVRESCAVALDAAEYFGQDDNDDKDCCIGSHDRDDVVADEETSKSSFARQKAFTNGVNREITIQENIIGSTTKIRAIDDIMGNPSITELQPHQRLRQQLELDPIRKQRDDSDRDDNEEKKMDVGDDYTSANVSKSKAVTDHRHGVLRNHFNVSI